MIGSATLLDRLARLENVCFDMFGSSDSVRCVSLWVFDHCHGLSYRFVGLL